MFDPVAGLMGGGFHVRADERAVIVLDPDLDAPMRRAVLTHELVHHERGGGPGRAGAPATLDLLVERDERAVDAEVARRLVPVDELDRVVAELVAGCGGASVTDVAAHFAVPSVGGPRCARPARRHDSARLSTDPVRERAEEVQARVRPGWEPGRARPGSRT